MLRIILFLAAIVPNVLAAQIADYGKVRLLTGYQLDDGSYQIGVEFDLNPGWKTYWRAPGAAGLPPVLAWDGSQNIGDISITWPTPKVFETAGMQTVGYTGKILLPIRITPETPGPVRIALNLQFGVCSDICVPAESVFLARLTGGEEQGKEAIQAAMLNVPLTARAAGLRDISCRIIPAGRDYEITAQLNFAQGFRNPVTVIEYDSVDVWIDETTTTPAGRAITAVASLSYYGAPPMFLNRNDIRVTVLGENRTVEIQGCPG